MIKKIIILPMILIALGIFHNSFADEIPFNTIRVKTDFNIWKINLKKVDWLNEYPQLTWNGFDIKLPKYTTKDFAENMNAYLINTPKSGLDKYKIKAYLEKVVAPEINREKQDVTISIDNDSKVKFDGFAMKGQEIDYEKAYNLFREAFKKKERDIRLPIRVIEPTINVVSDELKAKGITALLGTGETDFSGSPRNRRINIAVGLNSFNGQLIPPGGSSSAGKILGRVDASTGYLPELVIKGDQTVPEYGGGLCQVSTTVYRSLLFSALPITERKNHSYAVSYYDPQGLDATIYPPSPDLRFKNDTPGHILIQTTTVGDKAYSNIYGTHVDRYAELIGPYYYDYRGAPPAKVKYTDKLAPGQRKIVGGSHAGFKASWYRRISYTDESKKDVLEHIFSNYEARPLYTLIGKEKPGQENKNEASENGT